MAADWKVGPQRQTSTFVSGQLVPVMTVSFTTASGTTGSVQIPISQYTPTAVSAAIQARVDAIKGVEAL